jgi:hypothetical protein
VRFDFAQRERVGAYTWLSPNNKKKAPTCAGAQFVLGG